MPLPRLLLCALLPFAAMASDTYDMAGKVRAYVYETVQEVEWSSAGDRLRYSTSLTWKLVLKAKSATECNLTILRVQARHEGPGSQRSVDSAGPREADPDPLLGHLTALEGVTFGLILDPSTGTITRVTGTETIAKRVAAAVPNLLDPTGPSPIDEQARALYSPDHLQKLWTAVFALPTGPTRLPLAGPQGGTLIRTWTGSTWTATLAEPEIPVTLGKPPAEVTGLLTGLTGTGGLTLKDGLPHEATGDLTFTLRLTALTQPTEARHHLTWRLAPAL